MYMALSPHSWSIMSIDFYLVYMNEFVIRSVLEKPLIDIPLSFISFCKSLFHGVDMTPITSSWFSDFAIFTLFII